jgi:LysR family transcriptional regulator, hydrogen peroxide-inducible genes activator
MNISLIQLEYLVALDEHRHFVNAAKASFVTQPTLSMQIKKLEEELGILLFDRSKQPIIPTDAGKLIVAQAKSILRETRKIEDILLGYQEKISGDLTIGIIPTVSSFLVPHLLGNFSKSYPEVQLHIKELHTDQIVKLIDDDHLDVGILATPLHIDFLAERPVFYEKFLLYLNPSHPAYGKKPLTAKDLMDDKLWLLSQGNCFRNQSVNLCALQAKMDNNSFDYESGSLDTLKKIVDIEGGATVLPEWATYDLCSDNVKNLHHLEDDDTVREISIVYSRNFAKSRLVNTLEEMVKKSTPPKLISKRGNKVMEIM